VKRANQPQDLGIILAAGRTFRSPAATVFPSPRPDDSGGETAGI
jgi:hypothetical protein